MVATPPKPQCLIPHSSTLQLLTCILGPAEDGGHLLALGGVAAVAGDASADPHRALVGFDAAEVGGSGACAVGHLRVGVVGLGWGGGRGDKQPIPISTTASTIIIITPTTPLLLLSSPRP